MPDWITAEEPDDLDRWIARPSHRIVAVYLHREEAWDALLSAVEARRAIAIAMVPELDPDTYARALAMGCDGVVDSDQSPELITHAIEAALAGEVTLPAAVAQYLGKKCRAASTVSPPISEAEMALLREYARGLTVSDLSSLEHYGERTVRRRLQNICVKLGAKTRQEAIAIAARHGWLD